jgi:hypothetical protein
LVYINMLKSAYFPHMLDFYECVAVFSGSSCMGAQNL